MILYNTIMNIGKTKGEWYYENKRIYGELFRNHIIVAT